MHPGIYTLCACLCACVHNLCAETACVCIRAGYGQVLSIRGGWWWCGCEVYAEAVLAHANRLLSSCLTSAPRTCWHAVLRDTREAWRGLEVTVPGAAAFCLAETAQDSAGFAGLGLVSCPGAGGRAASPTQPLPPSCAEPCVCMTLSLPPSRTSPCFARGIFQ